MIKAAQDFKKFAKIDLLKYFDEVEDFFENSYPLILNFFNGNIDYVDTLHINKLNELINLSNKISEQFTNNKDRFLTVNFWELLDFFEDINLKLQTVCNLSKFLRSSRNNFIYKKGFLFNYSIGNNQTLENISKDILNDNDSDNSWVEISKLNDLMEIDYTTNGGENILLNKEIFVGNFVTGIIDIIDGESIYGKDISVDLSLIDNDISILNNKDTVFQTVDILSKLKQGDIPEFKSIGVSENMYVGSNLSSIAYSTIIRQMKSVFETDDLFINFRVKDIKQEQDYLEISFEIETKLGLLIEKTKII